MAYKIEVFTNEGIKNVNAKISSVSVSELEYSELDMAAINEVMGWTGEEAKDVVFISDDLNAVIEISRAYPNAPVKFCEI